MKANYYKLVVKDSSKGYIKTTRINCISEPDLKDELGGGMEADYFINTIKEVGGKLNFNLETLGKDVIYRLQLL